MVRRRRSETVESSEDFDYLRYTKINRHELDDEVQTHADRVMEANMMLVDAIDKRDNAKDTRETVYAELANKYRDEAGSKKITETEIKVRVAADSEYVEVLKDYRFWKIEVDKYENLKAAMMARGSMIKEMVRLLEVGYYQSDSVVSRVRDEAIKRRRNER